MRVLVGIGSHNVMVDHDIAQLGEHMDLADIVEGRNHITDSGGIPLGSDRYDPPDDVDFEYVECPYSESPTRYPGGKPNEIPMSGLEKRRLAQSFPQIRRQLLATRAAYLGLMGLSKDHDLTAEDGINILGIVQYLPTYLVDKAHNPVALEGALPQHLVVGSNCASGATGAIGSYTQGSINLLLPPGGELLEAAEREPEGGLVGPKTVCAASPNMITQYLDLLNKGSDSIKYGSIEDETDGLLSAAEVPNALLLGVNLESVLSYNQIAATADMKCTRILQTYNPRKHHYTVVQAALRRFSGEVGIFVDGYRRISSSANIALGRVAVNPEEFTHVIDENPYNFRAITLARTKGLKMPTS